MTCRADVTLNLHKKNNYFLTVMCLIWYSSCRSPVQSNCSLFFAIMFSHLHRTTHALRFCSTDSFIVSIKTLLINFILWFVHTFLKTMNLFLQYFLLLKANANFWNERLSENFVSKISQKFLKIMRNVNIGISKQWQSGNYL